MSLQFPHEENNQSSHWFECFVCDDIHFTNSPICPYCKNTMKKVKYVGVHLPSPNTPLETWEPDQINYLHDLSGENTELLTTWNVLEGFNQNVHFSRSEVIALHKLKIERR